jgi:hypothetical protein
MYNTWAMAHCHGLLRRSGKGKALQWAHFFEVRHLLRRLMGSWPPIATADPDLSPWTSRFRFVHLTTMSRTMYSDMNNSADEVFNLPNGKKLYAIKAGRYLHLAISN